MKKLLINRLEILTIEWNCYNGVVFNLLNIDAVLFGKYIDGSLFGINLSKNFLYISLFFSWMKIYHKRKKSHERNIRTN